jgi:hypothetical protein
MDSIRNVPPPEPVYTRSFRAQCPHGNGVRVSRPPSQKGTSVLPVVLALKQQPDARKLIPQQLWRYLDEPVLVSGWYPERDYWVLIEALVKTIDPASVGGDVWRYFAKFSAQRDIGGADVRVSQEDEAARAGLYRSFANMTGPETFFRRATRLWNQYHDTGRMEIVGGCVRTNALFVRLIGFVIPIEGFVRLQGYYLEEYARLLGMEVTSAVTHSTARRSPFCEWEYRLGRTPASEAYVASLPPLQVSGR